MYLTCPLLCERCKSGRASQTRNPTFRDWSRVQIFHPLMSLCGTKPDSAATCVSAGCLSLHRSIPGGDESRHSDDRCISAHSCASQLAKKALLCPPNNAARSLEARYCTFLVRRSHDSTVGSTTSRSHHGFERKGLRFLNPFNACSVSVSSPQLVGCWQKKDDRSLSFLFRPTLKAQAPLTHSQMPGAGTVSYRVRFSHQGDSSRASRAGFLRNETG